MKSEQVIELLKSGDFTIAFHDYSVCYLYKGKHEYERLPKKEVASFDLHDGFNGYACEIITLLVKALNGEIDSI